jgi:hypothetical protein
MAFTLIPPKSGSGARFLKRCGLFGFTIDPKGAFHLSNRVHTRRDEETGETISYRLEELLTLSIRKELEDQGWRVVHSSATPWRATWQGGCMHGY